MGFEPHRAKVSFISRARPWLILLGFIAGGAAIAFFLASDETLVKKLEERGPLSIPAAWGLGWRGCTEKARKPLATQLSHESKGSPDPSLRAACAWALGKAHSRDVVPPLEDAARYDAATSVRIAAIKAIGKNGDMNGRRAVERALEDAEAPMREAACLAAGDLKIHDLVPLIIPHLHEPVFDIRNAAAKALGEITGQEWGTDEAAWARWWDKNR